MNNKVKSKDNHLCIKCESLLQHNCLSIILFSVSTNVNVSNQKSTVVRTKPPSLNEHIALKEMFRFRISFKWCLRTLYLMKKPIADPCVGTDQTVESVQRALGAWVRIPL